MDDYNVSPEVANQVMREFDHRHGYPGPMFIRALIDLIIKADRMHRERLALVGYEQYVAAVDLAESVGGIEALRRIADRVGDPR